MFAAVLTTVLFSFAAIFANRSIKELGTTTANLARLCVALVLLGTYAHCFGSGMSGAGLNWFLLSGVIGMGLGDLALFAAMPRLGARLTILMCQCIAVPIAIQTEWMWMDTRLTLPQIAWAGLILVGVAIALMPSRRNPPKVSIAKIGFLFGFLAAAGQGLGAVISRHAYEISALAGESIDGISTAYQRIAGGLVITATYFIVKHYLSALAKPASEGEAPPRSIRGYFRTHRRGLRFMLVNALCGPTIGVSCYQWALATTPSGIVLPIVATTPLVIIPFSYWLDGDRPTRRSIIGGMIAVSGVVALTLVR
jgi:drug/metabolite transporter (DMT)-like permease